MIFDEFDPLEDKMLKIIDNDGNVLRPDLIPDLSNETIMEAYKAMLYERVADEMAVSYQRQGRMFTYPSNKGHEAIHIAAGMVIGGDDWLVPAFREIGAMLAKGVTMKEVFLFYNGNEHGSSFKNAARVLPINVPIGSQLAHAVGIGYSLKYRKQEDIVFTFIGDGGTSEGDFSEALNFAGVWQVPVVFTIQNNQYAISVPVRTQTKSVNLAVKSVAFGIPGIKVDGNDFFAMYLVYREASEYAHSGKGAILIEALTYRSAAHTTSDDPSKYRTREEEKEWEPADPLVRLKKFMEHKGIAIEKEEELIRQFKKKVDGEFLEAENYAPYPLEDVFRHTYVEMPHELERQKEEYEQFLEWKESRR
jgi:pyruvate dehydrogenase E1 component, alpha subunit